MNDDTKQKISELYDRVAKLEKEALTAFEYVDFSTWRDYKTAYCKDSDKLSDILTFLLRSNEFRKYENEQTCSKAAYEKLINRVWALETKRCVLKEDGEL